MNINPLNQINNRQPLMLEDVAKLLTHATMQLDTETVVSLRQARNVALERQLLKRPGFTLSVMHGSCRLISHLARQWAVTAILLGVIFFGGISYWINTQENDLAHLDIAILTDDLPLEVFVN